MNNKKLVIILSSLSVVCLVVLGACLLLLNKDAEVPVESPSAQEPTVEQEEVTVNEDTLLEDYAATRDDIGIDADGNLYSLNPGTPIEETEDVHEDNLIDTGDIIIIYPDNLKSQEHGDKILSIFGELYKDTPGQLSVSIMYVEEPYYYIEVDNTRECYKVNMETFETTSIDKIP